jgi:hypothetical protein
VDAEPLVSVGVPTYNRADSLRRALGSVLGQTHRRLELVISDNASNDATEQLCRSLAAGDERVRYLRQPVNAGPTANFNRLFEEMRGEYVMVLSDDDWLDDGYVASCLRELIADPELALVCGRARYLRDGELVRQGADMQLLDARPERRVLEYLRTVDENGVFYGLMQREVLHAAAPLRNVVGNDWLLTAAVVAQGQVRTLNGEALNRELGGTSADLSRLTSTLRLPRWQSLVPHLVIAWELVRDVAGRAPVYGRLGTSARMRLALAGAWTVIDWRSLAWHLTMPGVRALGRRRGFGWVWRGYERLTRALGAGRGN